MRVREKQIHNGETENHNDEIENAKLRGAGSAPSGVAGQPQIQGVGDENQQGDHIFGIVVPNGTGETIDPDETESGSDTDGNQADQHAALAHAIEKIERGEAPNDVADAMFVEQTLLGEVDDAQDAGEAKSGVGQNAERDMKGEDDAGGGRRGKAVGRSEWRDREKCQDEWQNKGTDRPLAVKQFQAEVGEGQEPAEEGHRAGEVMIRNGVQAAGALK